MADRAWARSLARSGYTHQIKWPMALGLETRWSIPGKLSRSRGDQTLFLLLLHSTLSMPWPRCPCPDLNLPRETLSGGH